MGGSLVLYKNYEYYINPIYESDVYISKYRFNDLPNNSSESVINVFCKKYNVNIKSVEDINNGDNKLVYFTLEMPDFPASVISSGANKAIFGAFDGEYKLKIFNETVLNIDDILNIYNNNYYGDYNKINTDKYITNLIYEQLMYASSQCARQVAPSTMCSFFIAKNHGDISRFINNQDLCDQLGKDGMELSSEYLKAVKKESEPQLALRLALKNYGLKNKDDNFAESVLSFLSACE